MLNSVDLSRRPIRDCVQVDISEMFGICGDARVHQIRGNLKLVFYFDPVFQIRFFFVNNWILILNFGFRFGPLILDWTIIWTMLWTLNLALQYF